MSEGERRGLAPSSLAKESFAFVFMGVSSQCRNCRLRPACVDGLDIGRVYEISEVFPKKRFNCPLHGEMVLVTLRRPALRVVLQSGLIEGTTITYKPISCDEVGCPYEALCKPEGILPGDKLRIIREVGRLPGSCVKASGMRIYEVEIR